MLKYYELVNFHDNSVWAIGCSTGMNFLSSSKYDDVDWRVEGSVKEGANAFVDGVRITSFDYGEWPSNEACSGLK